MSLFRKIVDFGRLSAVRRGCVIEALVLPPLIAFGFRVSGVPRTHNALRKFAKRRRNTGGEESADLLIANVKWAQRLVKRRTGIGGTCLIRSLTMWTILLRRGIETELLVGFRKSEFGEIQGHAWLERQGQILNERRETALSYSTQGGPVSFDARWL